MIQPRIESLTTACIQTLTPSISATENLALVISMEISIVVGFGMQAQRIHTSRACIPILTPPILAPLQFEICVTPPFLMHIEFSLSLFPGGAEGFAGAADYAYLIKPLYTPQTVPQIRAAAEYLGMHDVLDSTKRYLYTTIFAHWRTATSFLQHYQPMGCTVDSYIETRCLKVLVAALARAFGETKHLSAPMSLRPNLQETPCQALSEILVRTASLPDAYAAEALDALVEADVNLNVKCRQGRGVRGWLGSVLEDECGSERARCWVVLCLGRMALRSAPEGRPGLELSSQYWCCLLEWVDRLVVAVEEDEDMQVWVSLHSRLYALFFFREW